MRRPPAGFSHSTGDDPAGHGSHAGFQTGHAPSAASPQHAESSSTSFPLASKHVAQSPANDARTARVFSGEVQDAHALSASRPSFPSASLHGTRRHARQGRDAFQKRESRVWVPALPEREVVEAGRMTDLRGEASGSL